MKKPDENTTTLIDHYLMMVGKLVNNAAVCDSILFETFRIISGCNEGIASAIYFSAESIHAKRNIIRRILTVLDDKIESEIIEKIIAATEKSHAQRNELGHAALIATNDGTLRRHNPRNQGQAQKPVTGPYLDALLKHSSEAQILALTQIHALRQRRGIPQPIVS